MHPIKQFVGGGAIFVAFAGVGALGAKAGAEYTAADPSTATVRHAPALVIDIGARCAEDDPCWSWSTMGDHRRGVRVGGKLRVVNACTFRRLVLSGQVDRGADPMRGDAWAIKYGCGSTATATL